MVAPRRSSLELIPNEGTRKMTFRKRKKSIYKKADELSKLCGIDVCLIVYEADQKKGRAVQPETWPRDPNQFKRILNKYKDSKDTSTPRLKRNFIMSDFYEDKKDHVDEDDEKFQNSGKKIFEEEYPTKFQNLGKKISEEEYPRWDDRIDDFSQDELTELIASLESKIHVATKKIDSMERYMGFAKKQNQSLVWEEINHDEQPYQVPALMSPPSLVHCPMLPSAWVSSSENR
ncbi:PREDICTED: agamous MADS-box [Prunus dulcis]|uniref:PREDICTED: agamous MADS-box n=1 Tax=Prunus dulcis TaxID=3755 RepID=A0A5E4FZ95_PRUDU|nr:agamous-like MADS-box protein AGL82 [Prunus dulcis]XP_034225135.1 agamous-like MADS-box protein AGL82 [Prunus dulcis]XP_034225136.1 agamous-like MADS-box protein AGL82 [Prunus dulcis]VVA32799.1 PREDICTED: agamous MADS-box [Prunus dulcis]